jgi:geranylgeranyl pyrophosphate synthase
MIGVAESRQRAVQLVDEAVNALKIFDRRADSLRHVARFIVERDH